jgi:hypothetical protein
MPGVEYALYSHAILADVDCTTLLRIRQQLEPKNGTLVIAFQIVAQHHVS